MSEQRDRAEGQTFERLEKGNVPSKLKQVINKQGRAENEACVIQGNKSVPSGSDVVFPSQWLLTLT